MKKISWIIGLALLILSGCSDDNEQGKATAPQKKQVASQQHAPVDPKKDAGIWPPPQDGPKNQESILPADQWTRKNYVMILDGSGSMGDQRCSGNTTKNVVAQEAVMEWAQSVPADAHLGLIVFDQKGFSVRLQIGQDRRQQFIEQVQNVEPGSTTPLTQAVQTAYELLTDQARKQLGYGEYHMVIVTDGAANLPEELTAEVNNVLAHSPIIISTIGFCITTTHSLNQPGRTIYKAADNPEALRQGLQDILAESESFDDVTAF
ncbi:MAG: vWA domain-containing protein [Candidatus Electrothrix sp. GW3-4]|uniref:vWA domain-containing protein n=1 Tax=Candidatus Electrothrix sp. GW3-4 TaxID=3126740 RepID=UPI0030D224F6